ncbi:hypothetical protein GF312_06350 [Candidatus Poribacteria bacterium]|nr:hypothetical protein [Candidatus Poribacteria bacterium]
MDFMKTVLKRRTYRGQFTHKPVSQKDLETIVEAARWSPSPFNVQPWEIITIEKQDTKDKLAKLVLKSMSAQMGDSRFLDDVSKWMSLSKDEWVQRSEGVMIDDHMDIPGFIKDKSKLRPLLKNAKNMSFLGKLGLGKIGASKFVEHIKNAPLIMIIIMNLKRMSPGENRMTWMYMGMGAFVEHILLAAISLNIGTHFINAPLETKKDRVKLRHILSIPDHYEPVCLLRLGYIQGNAGESVRLPSEKILHREKFRPKGNDKS